MEIKTAVRKATPALIVLWGPSGSGKTLSALKIARGLVGPKGKIGLVDTENRRAEFYASEVGGWDHLDFQPPFTPQRYTDAFKAFENAGEYDCVIVDSMSHVWEGDGGVLDMASASNYPGLLKWQAPKMAYKRMVNNLLRAPYHVIFCLRAKEGVVQIGRGKDASIESVGLEPICEKNFIYEMTVSALIGPDHKPLFQPIDRFRCNPIIPAVKAPEDLLPAIHVGEFLSEQTGKDIADWVGGGAPVDNEFEQLARVARDISTMGMERLGQHWSSLTPAQQHKLASIKEDLKRIASQADAERQPADGEPLGDPLDDKFTHAAE